MPSFAYLSDKEAYGKVLSWAEELNIKSRLKAYRIAANMITTTKKKVGRYGHYHLIVLDPKHESVEITHFAKKKLEEANEEYTKVEKQMLDGQPLQVVLVSTDSIEDLHKAYPNYFLDTQEFLTGLMKVQIEFKKS